MPHRAEVLVRMVEGILHGPLVGLVVSHDATLDLLDRQLARIDRLAAIQQAPDEPHAELRLAARDGGAGPRRFEERGVAVPERARQEAEAYLALERGGHLRIEIERPSAGEPTPEHFREMLDAAVAIADLNQRLNPTDPST